MCLVSELILKMDDYPVLRMMHILQVSKNPQVSVRNLLDMQVKYFSSQQRLAFCTCYE